METNAGCTKQYWVTVMGAAGVGKTSIINQFLYGDFATKYKKTVEELHRAEYDDGGVKLTLDILDTAGAYQFPAMKKLAASKSDAFVLVFSMADMASFEEIIKLRQFILSESPSEYVPIVIVGNKSDLSSTNQTMCKETVDAIVCVDWNSSFVHSSAKDNKNIVNIFKELLKQSKLECNLGVAVKEKGNNSLTKTQQKTLTKKRKPKFFFRGIFAKQGSNTV